MWLLLITITIYLTNYLIVVTNNKKNKEKPTDL